MGSIDDFQIWTQGQGRYTSYWLPSFDDVNEKVIFNISFEIDYKLAFILDFQTENKFEKKRNNECLVMHLFMNQKFCIEVQNEKTDVFLFSDVSHWEI